VTAEGRAMHDPGISRAAPDNARRPHLAPVPSPAEQSSFEDRLVDLLVRINEGWLQRQEAGR
jgi:hypothetical protein